MKDIRYWLKEENAGRKNWLWFNIEVGLGLKFGVNEKYRLIWELQGIEFPNFGNLWKASRDFCYRYYPEENLTITNAEKADGRVHKFYGQCKDLNV